MKKICTFLMMVFCMQTVKATVYYVSPTGVTSNTGTSASSPWPVQYAADNTMPGDIVYFLTGTYQIPFDAWLKITRSGTVNAYITYAAAPGNKPVVQAPNPSYAWQGIKVLASYIIIEGFELIGNNANITLAQAESAYNKAIGDYGFAFGYDGSATNTSGIFIGREDNGSGGLTPVPHHITVRNCIVHDFPGGGIGSDQADFIVFENNTVYNNSWYTYFANSGISLFHSQNTQSSYSGYANIISNNKVYNNKTLVKWLFTQGYSDGNGIIIDDNYNGQIVDSNDNPIGIPYIGSTLVVNNLSYLNGAGGLHVYASANIDIINNSTYKNNSTSLNYGEMDAVDATNVRFINNIAYASPGKNVTIIDPYNQNVVFDYNIYFNGPIQDTGLHDIIADPKYVDALNGNLFLQKGSPAINAGDNAGAPAKDITGVSRPQGPKDDIGAYETPSPYVSPTALSVSPTSFNLVGNGSQVLTTTFTPTNTTNKYVIWTSSNSSVATVNNSGVVSGGLNGGGPATITGTTQDGNISASATVTVTYVAPASISINQANGSLFGNDVLQLTATIMPATANNQTVTWTTSTPSVATVSANGLVTCLKGGTVIITATTINGLTASRTFTVSPWAKIESDAPGWQYSENTYNWDQDTLNSGGKTYSLFDTIGTNISCNFTGTKVQVYGKKANDPELGRGDILIDKTVAGNNISWRKTTWPRDSAAWQQLIWESGNLSSGAHNIKIRLIDALKYIEVDYILVYVGTAGSVSGTRSINTVAVNLTTTGTADWKHFYKNVRKSGVTVPITNYTVIGGSATGYTNDLRNMSWSDGTPTAISTNNKNGRYIAGIGKGFSFTAKAGNGTNTLYVYVGGWNSGGKLTAQLSNSSVVNYTDSTSTISGQWDAVYTITYDAAQAGQTITIKWTQPSGTGNVTIQAAALQGNASKSSTFALDNLNSRVSFFPNPATNIVNINLGSISDDQPVSIKVTDIMGRTVYTKTVNHISLVQIPVRQFGRRLYVFTLVKKDEIITKKIVVQ